MIVPFLFYKKSTSKSKVVWTHVHPQKQIKWKLFYSQKMLGYMLIDVLIVFYPDIVHTLLHWLFHGKQAKVDRTDFITSCGNTARSF